MEKTGEITKKVTKETSVCVFDFTLFDDIPYEVIKVALAKICKKYTFQQEKGEETGTIHFQGRFSLKNKKRKCDVIRVCSKDLGWLKFHISITSKENRTNDFYVTKDETRIAGPFSDKEVIEDIPPDVLEMKTLYPWQQQMCDLLHEDSNRAIDIVYDPEGCKGKTALTRYMRHYHGAQLIPLLNDAKDIMRIAYNSITKKGIKSIYMIDMPRAVAKDKLQQFFSGIELLKSGYAYDDRYEFNDITFKKPRVCVFTNTYPTMNFMSKDMWNIWKIEDNQLISLVKNGVDVNF